MPTGSVCGLGGLEATVSLSIRKLIRHRKETLSRRGPPASSPSALTPSISDPCLDATAARQPNRVCRSGSEQHSLPSSEDPEAGQVLYHVRGESYREGGGGHRGFVPRLQEPPRAGGVAQSADLLAAAPSPLLSSQVPAQPRRAAPTTPPPLVKRRDREALVASGSGEKGLGGRWHGAGWVGDWAWRAPRELASTAPLSAHRRPQHHTLWGQLRVQQLRQQCLP